MLRKSLILESLRTTTFLLLTFLQDNEYRTVRALPPWEGQARWEHDITLEMALALPLAQCPQQLFLVLFLSIQRDGFCLSHNGERQSLPSVIEWKVCILCCSQLCLYPLRWLQSGRHLPRKRLGWHVVQQGIYSWINSCMAAFKYLAEEIFWQGQALQWDWQWSLAHMHQALNALEQWEGLRNIVLSRRFTKPDSKKSCNIGTCSHSEFV